MMKILLISTNNEKLPMPVAPIGAAYLAGMLRSKGFFVSILDLCFVKDEETAITTRINEYIPDIVGISLRNLDNSTAFGNRSYIERLKRLTDTVKHVTSAVMVIGGSGFSTSPEPLLNYLDLDYGIVGEGEISLLQFVRRIENGKDVTSVPGLVFRDGTGIKRNVLEKFAILDNLPMPAWDLINLKKYLKHGGYGGIQNKRGCMFNCIYCNYPVIEGQCYRLRSPELVVDEIEMLHVLHGVKHFFFVDSVFSFPDHHAKDICQEIIRRDLKISWEAMTNPRGITDELVELMERSGCIGVELGIDSASEEMLFRMGKNFTCENIAMTAKLYKRYGIPFSIYLLLGGPGETDLTIKETVDFLDRIEQPNQVLMNFGIRVYAGTPLAVSAIKEGIIENEDQLLHSVTYVSKELKDNYFPVLDSYCHSRLHWSNATDWNSPISGIMMKTAQILKLRPFWKNAKILGYIRKLRGVFT